MAPIQQFKCQPCPDLAGAAPDLASDPGVGCFVLFFPKVSQTNILLLKIA